MSSARRKRGVVDRALFGDAPVRLSERRRRKRLFYSGLLLLTLLVLLVLVSWISHSERFRISETHVTGTEEVSAESVEAAVETVLDDGRFHLFARDNILWYPKEEIAKKIIEVNPRVREVHTARNSLFGTMLDVRIIEREVASVWCEENECFAMDASGFIFAPFNALVSSRMFVRFEGGLGGRESVGTQYIPGEFDRIQMLLERIAYLEPIRVVVTSADDFEVWFVNGMHIRALFEQDNEVIVSNLRVTLESEPVRDRVDDLEYIDLRFGNRVYYCFKED